MFNNTLSRFKTTEENNELIELVKDFEMCTKALVEKEQLQEELEKVASGKYVRVLKQIELIDQIISQTKNRMRQQIFLVEKSLNGSTNPQFRATLEQIRAYLKGGRPTRKQRFFTEGQQQINQPSGFNSSKLLESARDRISDYRDQRFKGLNDELREMLQKKPIYISQDGVIGKDDIFLALLEKQINQEEVKNRQNKVVKEMEMEGGSPQIKPSKGISEIFKTETQIDGETYYRERSHNMKDSAKKASRILFQKKFGNSLVKLRQEKNQNLRSQMFQEKAQLRRLVTMKLDDKQKYGKTFKLEQLKVLQRHSEHHPGKPPNELDQLKRFGQKFIRAMDGHFYSFRQEKHGLQCEINSYRNNYKQGMADMQDRYDSLKRSIY